MTSPAIVAFQMVNLVEADFSKRKIFGLALCSFLQKTTEVFKSDIRKVDFNKGQTELKLKVEKEILELNGNVTDRFQKAKPFVFGMNKE